MAVINTSQYRMAERMAGGDLAGKILAAQAAGSSAEEISRQLYKDYGIEVTGQTLRRWIVDLAASEGVA